MIAEQPEDDHPRADHHQQGCDSQEQGSTLCRLLALTVRVDNVLRILFVCHNLSIEAGITIQSEPADWYLRAMLILHYF